MSKKEKEVKIVEPELPIIPSFTGTVHTIVYKPHQGFADYAVATMTIEDGLIIGTVYSDPYAAFEALAKLELANSRLLEKMRRGYPGGFQHV